MKDIRWVGKQVFDNVEELEDGHVEIVVDVSDFLDEVDTDVLEKYAKYHLDLIHLDNCDTVEDASVDDLVWELSRRNSFSFLGEIEDEEMIEHLQDCGYKVVDNEDTLNDSLDFVHQGMLDEITKKFLESSWEERDLIYKKII
jgi:hypothetical protein